jgi:hypothetical protein
MILCSAQSIAVTPNDFVVETTRDLVKLCKASPGADLYNSARAFCLGYLEGAWSYHQALTAGAKFNAIACPGPEVTRDQAVDVFLAWAKKKAKSAGDETAVHGVMRAFSNKWPCSTE